MTNRWSFIYKFRLHWSCKDDYIVKNRPEFKSDTSRLRGEHVTIRKIIEQHTNLRWVTDVRYGNSTSVTEKKK